MASDAEDAWTNVRNTDGSILGPDGGNWTTSINGAHQFGTFLDNLCGKGSDDQKAAIAAIQQAAADAAQLASMNALPTTKPKCHSKPLIRIDRHCQVTVQWTARTHDEEDCGSG